MEERYFGEKTPKLGFGLMRLPKLENGKIDIEQTKEMVDMFLAGGLTYFDTAFAYDKGDSERAAKIALVDRYPRDSFTLATKLCCWPTDITAEEAKAELFVSLERTGAGYFDYYLLHAIQDSNINRYDEMGIWDFVKEQKEKGRIKHWGFSFHGSPELLEELLTKHPDAEFVQLQINYADWENPEVNSRICYEIVRKHGKSVVIMEPIKGGKLANPNDNVKAIFDSYGSDASYASWAIRYAASLDGVIAVLSGMSNIAQMADNVSYMKEFKPLNADEREVIRKVQEELNKVENVPCTACHYCTDGCPMGIHIPEIFVALNMHLAGKKEEAQEEYDRVTAEGGKASECIQCGQCEGVCPQSIPVIANLQKAAELFE